MKLAVKRGVDLSWRAWDHMELDHMELTRCALHLQFLWCSDNKPYLFSSDFIGAPLLPDMETNGFVAAGTCTDQVFFCGTQTLVVI